MDTCITEFLFILFFHRLAEKQIFTENSVFLELYKYSIQQIPKRFIISEEHVLAADQKSLSILDKYIPISFNRSSFLESQIKKYKIELNVVEKNKEVL